MPIQTTFPIAQINQLAQKESYVKNYYRPVYYIHKWWARRLGSVFRSIVLATFLDKGEDVWERYYKGADFGGKIVLDPFMGGGTTIGEALRLGCKVIGVDLNPVAWWVVKKEIAPVDLEELDRAFRELEQSVAGEISQYYRTTCPHCHQVADVMYVFWVKVVNCVACGQEVRLHTSYKIAERKGIQTVFCPQCGQVFKEPKARNVTCPNCSYSFDVSKGPAGKSTYTCPSCGQKHSIVDTVRRSGDVPEHEMYALEYYSRRCGRNYKKADEDDRALYEKAAREFARQKAALLMPTQAVPDGKETHRLFGYGYKRFPQLFNKRQLLCLSKLLKAITEVEDENTREYMLTLFSSCLETNNIFCTYNSYGAGRVRHIFSLHAYIPPKQPLENSVWGNTEYGSGTFASLYTSRLRRAKEYCLRPFEKQIDDNGKVTDVVIKGDKIEGRLAHSFEELTNTNKNALLLCQTSEELQLIPDGQVDAIITDPPYFDNVMYSELADFFYVWLRLYLKDKYPYFQSELSPRLNEIVKNEKQGKTEEDFLAGLTRVFKECHRVLKDGRPLIFTFHHKGGEAWSSVLGAVINAGFYVSDIYPIHAEKGSSLHIWDKQSIEYDAVVVCSKRTEETSITWAELEDQIYFRAEETLRELSRNNGLISKADISVIVFGKCLELYSKHYPNVIENGKRVKVEEAIGRMWDVIDALAADEALTRIPQDTDELTRTYALFLAGRKSLPFDELNKSLRPRGLNVSDLERERLIEGQRRELVVLSPSQRAGFIEEKMERGKRLYDIDKIHYLYHLYWGGRDFIGHKKQWQSSTLDELCRLISERTGDRSYDKITEMRLL